MNIQLIADPQYLPFFSEFLKRQQGVVLEGKPDMVWDASFLNPSEKLDRLSKLESNAVLITNTLTLTATAARAVLASDSRVIGIPMLPNYFERQTTVEVANPFGSNASSDVPDNLLSILGKTGEAIQDSLGGVFPRTLAMIVNEAAFAVQESVAVPQDIDIAMKLGTNYPKGPLAWCDEIGAEVFVAILDALGREFGPERYRVSTLLRRHAEAGLKFIPV